MADADNHRVIDVWEELHSLFRKTIGYDDFPEVIVLSLTPGQLQTCVRYFITHAREVTTSFMLADTRDDVLAVSPEAAATALSEGFIIGAMSVDFPGLPSLGIFIDSPISFSISFIPGREWHYLSVLTLFELLREIRTMAPMSIFQLDNRHFNRKERKVFEVTLREYLDEKF